MIPKMLALVCSHLAQINQQIHRSQLMWWMSRMMMRDIRLAWVSQIKD